MQPNEAKSQSAPQLRRGELLLWFVWALGTLLFSIHVIGTKLFLIYRYGWSKVQHEHLRILDMPKGHDWPVSNGDMIREGFFIHFLISLFCWWALFFATYPFVRRLLPPEKRAAK